MAGWPGWIGSFDPIALRSFVQVDLEKILAMAGAVRLYAFEQL
jgi:hypothetical protein